ncbi:CLM6 protein, partial [Amia calva]|nr:CLM6 protein [Amia calva]
ECSYEQGHATLPKVWCKQNSSLCCSGFATANLEESLHEGQVVIRVQPERLSFTVSVTHLPEGPGVYWCGVLQPNNTIIKLREQTFSTCECGSPGPLFTDNNQPNHQALRHTVVQQYLTHLTKHNKLQMQWIGC